MPLDEVFQRLEVGPGMTPTADDVQLVSSAEGLADAAQYIEAHLGSVAALEKVLRLLEAAAAHGHLPASGSSALLQALVHLMETHPQAPALGAMASAAALPFLATSDGQCQFVAAGAIPEVLQLMHRSPDDGQLQQTCCAVLAELAANRNFIKALHSENAMDVVVAAMHWHIMNPNTLKHHLRLLRRLIANDTMRQVAGQQGVLEGIVAAMRTPQCTGALREECAWALLDLVIDDAANAQRLVVAGALDLLLGPRIVGDGVANLKVMAHLIAQDEALPAQLVRGGQLVQLLKDMEEALADVPLQLEYSGLLATLATKEELFDRVGELAIPTLCRVVRQHSTHVPILLRCVFTLANLTTVAVNQQRLRASEGVPLLLDCLQQHPSCLELQLQCCKLMQNLAAKDEGLREDIILECGVKYICDVMQAHPSCGELQQLYLSVLVNLGEEVDVHRLI